MSKEQGVVDRGIMKKILALVTVVILVGCSNGSVPIGVTKQDNSIKTTQQQEVNITEDNSVSSINNPFFFMRR